MSVDKEMTHMHFDVLQEISNIGLGNAATSLAELLQKRVDLEVPQATFVDVEQVFSMVGGLEDVVACVHLGFEGDIAGTVMYIFTEQSVYKLVDILLNQEIGTTKELDELGNSIIMEIGNILTGTFINAISSMTGLNIYTSVPMFAFDMMGAILSASLVASGHWDEKVLLIETHFVQNNEQIKGHFFLLPETGFLNKLFMALGLPLNNVNEI